MSERHNAVKQRKRGLTAVAVAVLCVLGASVPLFSPNLQQPYALPPPVFDDSVLPDYVIRVMRDGTEVEIVGGFKTGLAADTAKVLVALPHVRVIHLDSPGGRRAEGQKLFDLIRERGLSTYVASRCMSACTLAFAGGRERFLRTNAVLGFNRGTFHGIRESGSDQILADAFTRANFNRQFIARSLATPDTDVWCPDAQVLLDAGVVTRLAGTDEFAASPFGAHPNEERIARLLAAESVLRVMKEREPRKFATMADAYHEAVALGRTQAETIAVTRAHVVRFNATMILLADDDVVVDYVSLLVDQFTELNGRSSRSCYVYASGNGLEDDVGLHLSPPLSEREALLQARVLRTAAPREPTPDADHNVLWEKFEQELAAVGMTDKEREVLSAAHVDPSRQAAYCSAMITYFKAILQLPRAEAAAVIRIVGPR
jgi:hypothetical protein